MSAKRQAFKGKILITLIQFHRFTFVGYVLHNAFSFDQAGWQDQMELIVDIFYS